MGFVSETAALRQLLCSLQAPHTAAVLISAGDCVGAWLCLAFLSESQKRGEKISPKKGSPPAIWDFTTSPPSAVPASPPALHTQQFQACWVGRALTLSAHLLHKHLSLLSIFLPKKKSLLDPQELLPEGRDWGLPVPPAPQTWFFVSNSPFPALHPQFSILNSPS